MNIISYIFYLIFKIIFQFVPKYLSLNSPIPGASLSELNVVSTVPVMSLILLNLPIRWYRPFSDETILTIVMFSSLTPFEMSSFRAS